MCSTPERLHNHYIIYKIDKLISAFFLVRRHEIYDLYPNKFVQLNEQRIYVLNSLFNQPETYLLACIVDYFSNSKEFTK